MNSDWSNQGHTLSIQHGDVCYHFQKQVSLDSHTQVTLSVVESLSGTWSVPGNVINYAGLPESVKDELADLECVVLQ